MTISGAQSIYRTVDILETLLRAGRGLTAREIADAASLATSTTHRILFVLRERGLVRQEKKTRLYYAEDMWLNTGLLDVPRALQNRYGDLPLKLAERFGHTAYLYCRLGYRCLCLERAEGTNSVQVFTARPGTSRVLGNGTGTFGILAFLDEAEREQVLRVTLPEFRHLLLRGEKAMRVDLAAARGNGYVFGVGHRLADIATVALPIYRDREAVGALSVSGIHNQAWRDTQDAMVRFMREVLEERDPGPETP